MRKLFVPFLAATVAVVGLAVALDRPAEAGTNEAWTRCRTNLVPDVESMEMTVRGDRGGSFPAGSSPANVLQPGDVFRIIPIPTDRVMTGNNVWHPAAGSGSPAPGNWPFPGMSQYSPILRFNHTPSGWVGNPAQATAFGGCTEWSPQIPVRMLFYVNDTDLGNNRGAWRFTVRIYRATAQATDELDRCRRQEPPQQMMTVAVAGNGGGSAPPGSNPGNIIGRNDVVRIVPLGNDVVFANTGGDPYGPFGDSIAASGGFPFPGLIRYAPVLRFNNNPGGWRGPAPSNAFEWSGCLQWHLNDPVRLLFYVNDDNITDNWGQWRFQVQVYRPRS